MTREALKVRRAVEPYVMVPGKETHVEPVTRVVGCTAGAEEHELLSRAGALERQPLARRCHHGTLLSRREMHDPISLPETTARPRRWIGIGLVDQEPVVRFLGVE